MLRLKNGLREKGMPAMKKAPFEFFEEYGQGSEATAAATLECPWLLVAPEVEKVVEDAEPGPFAKEQGRRRVGSWIAISWACLTLLAGYSILFLNLLQLP
jgi:hypothetical protein